MELILRVLLPLGLVFPSLSLVTLIASAVTARTTGRHASAVLMPFIGPVLLTGWILLSGFSPLLIPLVWLLDPGTVLFLLFLWGWMRELWETSRWTEVLRLEGVHDGDRAAILTLYRSGRYVLEVARRHREKDDQGVVGVRMGEPGTYRPTSDGYALVSHTARHRAFRNAEESLLFSEDPPSPDDKEDFLCLDGWRWHVLPK